MTTSEQVNELAAALAKAQAQISGAEKAGVNPHFKSKYAELSSIWDACREPLTKNGLSVVQAAEVSEDGRVGVTTRLLHASGQWISGTLEMKPTKDDPQGVGSCLTYARRYALAAMVGVAPEDDDGNAASAKPTNGQQTKKPEQPEGYAAWLRQLEETADEGITAYRKAFLASPEPFRMYRVQHDNARHESLKKRAEMVAKETA